MIYRYGLECPGCRARIILRVTVGIEIEQPFFVVCGNCGTVIKGKQVIWYHPHPGARLDMESAQLIDAQSESGFMETISVNPDLPSLRTATAIGDEGGSSFLHNAHLLGPAFMETMDRISRFRHMASEEGAAIRRLGSFYLRKDWSRFRAEGKRLFEQQWPNPTKELQHHDVLPQVFLLAYSPLLVGDWLSRFVTEWDTLLTSNESTLPAQRAFAEAAIDDGQIGELQRLVLERFDFIATHKSALLPAIPAELYKDGVEKAVAELRMPRDDFDILKGHYVDCYELAHKMLSIIVGTINVVQRGGPDSFDPAITSALAAQGLKNFKRIPTLVAFDGKPNAPKRAFLEPVRVCKALWDELLDRELRNAVGHYGTQHDLRTGMILVDGEAHCSYLEFVVKTMRMTHVLLCLLHVLKMCHMGLLLTADGATSQATPRRNHFKQRKRRSR